MSPILGRHTFPNTGKARKFPHDKGPCIGPEDTRTWPVPRSLPHTLDERGEDSHTLRWNTECICHSRGRILFGRSTCSCPVLFGEISFELSNSLEIKKYLHVWQSPRRVNRVCRWERTRNASSILGRQAITRFAIHASGTALLGAVLAISAVPPLVESGAEWLLLLLSECDGGGDYEECDDYVGMMIMMMRHSVVFVTSFY